MISIYIISVRLQSRVQQMCKYCATEYFHRLIVKIRTLFYRDSVVRIFGEREAIFVYCWLKYVYERIVYCVYT